ncbi:MAG: hypothetical protein N4A33_12715 [Bacteriovoracaceae bacterium]|jgi:hypothetical protein|nr:hypothetical protein [Bacteriovoracaceae bacterium]
MINNLIDESIFVNINEKKVAYITINHPYSSLGEKRVNYFFSALMAFKRDGYLKHFPYGTLPFDVSDFISTHHIFIEKRHNDFKIIMSYKTISNKVCDIHRVLLPITEIFLKNDLAEHRLALDNFTKKDEISYGFGWTISPEISCINTRKLLKELFLSTLFNYYRYKGIQKSTCLGVLTSRTDQFFLNFGYQPLFNETTKEYLKSFSVKEFNDIEAKLLVCDNFSLQARQLGKKYYDLFKKGYDFLEHDVSRKKVA